MENKNSLLSFVFGDDEELAEEFRGYIRDCIKSEYMKSKRYDRLMSIYTELTDLSLTLSEAEDILTKISSTQAEHIGRKFVQGIVLSLNGADALKLTSRFDSSDIEQIIGLSAEVIGFIIKTPGIDLEDIFRQWRTLRKEDYLCS